MEECAVWYLGEEGRALLNLQMAHASSPVSAMSPDGLADSRVFLAA
jgi:hypothetical protein